MYCISAYKLSLNFEVCSSTAEDGSGSVQVGDSTHEISPWVFVEFKLLLEKIESIRESPLPQPKKN